MNENQSIFISWGGRTNIFQIPGIAKKGQEGVLGHAKILWSFTHFCRQNVAIRICALLWSNPPESQDLGFTGGGDLLAVPGF